MKLHLVRSESESGRAWLVPRIIRVVLSIVVCTTLRAGGLAAGAEPTPPGVIDGAELVREPAVVGRVISPEGRAIGGARVSLQIRYGSNFEHATFASARS